MKTQRSADVWSGLFVAALGVLVNVASFSISSPIAERLPPRTLPLILGSTTLMAGLLLGFKAWRFRGENPVVPWPDREGAIRVILTLVALAIYIPLIPLIGMPLATALFVGASIWYLDRRVPRAILIGLLAGGAVLLVFVHFLELSFPVGPLRW